MWKVIFQSLWLPVSWIHLISTQVFLPAFLALRLFFNSFHIYKWCAWQIGYRDCYTCSRVFLKITHFAYEPVYCSLCKVTSHSDMDERSWFECLQCTTPSWLKASSDFNLSVTHTNPRSTYRVWLYQIKIYFPIISCNSFLIKCL